MQIYFVSLIVNQDFDKLKWMITPFHGLSLAALKDISNGFLCHLNKKKIPLQSFNVRWIKYSETIVNLFQYIDNILSFNTNLEDCYNNLIIVFNEFVNNGLIISKKKMELCKEYIEFLGMNT